MSRAKEQARRLAETHDLSPDGLYTLLTQREEEVDRYLQEQARETARQHYGNSIYIRGLIEFTNYCKNDCLYCGIRRSNAQADRYRLTKKDILDCCRQGYALGYRTFVLQGGEDPYYTDERLTEIVAAIHTAYPDCAITLSCGERSEESYRALFEAGAERYLLRHETASEAHYCRLHPPQMSFANRMNCLRVLRDIGYQTGCGFMVGSPYQTPADLVQDLRFIKEFRPHMVGIGPFIAHHETPFRDEPNGTVDLTLYLLSIIRLLLPEVLLPATTALGTLSPRGREEGILHGANVVMPNLSPVRVRKKYELYDNKICTGEEAAECRGCLERRIESVGYQVVSDRGDSLIR